MSEKPILFSGPMVRALIAGTKTQTRRLFKPRGFEFETHPVSGDRYNEYRPYRDGTWDSSRITGSGPMHAFGWGEHLYAYLSHAPGDRLYVREHWRTSNALDQVAPRDLKRTEDAVIDYTPLRFEADHETVNYRPDVDPPFGKLRIAMHMPRWASRITLTVTDVRVERLQDISEADAIAEGIECIDAPGGNFKGSWGMYDDTPAGGGGWSDPRRSYQSLWTKINGVESWHWNPWIAAYTFRVQLGNIDQIGASNV